MQLAAVINYRTQAIIKREVKQQIFSKRFIFTTLALPAFLFIVVGLQLMMQNLAEDDDIKLNVFSDSSELIERLQELMGRVYVDASSIDAITYELADQEVLDKFIAQNRDRLLGGEISAVVYVPATALEDKQIKFYSNNAGNQALLSNIRRAVNSAVIAQYIDEQSLDSEIVDFIELNVGIENTRVTETGEFAGSAIGQQAVAVFFTILLYFSLLLISAPAMGAVNEEKVNRVVELVLASVSPNELMAGKIIGSAIAGLTQILIWFIPVILILSGSLPVLISIVELNIQINVFMIFYFLVNYLIGVLIFLSIFCAFGAMFDNPQDAQSSIFPVMLLVVVPFLLALTVVNNPASLLAQISSMMPFASILVMPARMSLIDIPLWQFIMALFINLATLYAVILLSGKIYRLTILMTGKSPGWREIYKWLFFG